MGPKCWSEEMFGKLLDAGLNVARFNFSHGDHQAQQEVLDRVRGVIAAKGSNAAVLLDTKGPEIRTAMLKDHAPIELEAGQDIIVFAAGAEYTTWEGYKTETETKIGLSYAKLCQSVKTGNRILIADGTIVIEVLEILSDTELKGKVLNFYGGSWDLKAYSTNSSILVGLATILKENPELVLNIHGKQVGSCRARITKDPRTGKTFAACFPGIENTLQPDALARARALNTLNALKEMGCQNRMTTSSQVSAVKQIVFQVRGIKAAQTEGEEPSCSCCGRPVEAKVRARGVC